MKLATLLFALIALPGGAERSGEPIMLDFTAAWCGPCRSMKPAVEQLIQKGYPIRPVDIDQAPEMAERYKVTGVPCFVVIDPADGRELARSSGAQPAANLANLYREARAKLQPNPRDDDQDETRAATEPESDPQPEPAPAPRPSADVPNPKPWETVVRIKVHGQGFMGFGSGTVIHSSPKEAIVLTCAHIFKIEGRRQQPVPSQFPLRITIDLFDGKLTDQRPRQVHYANETFEGEALDYNFGLDVGLIRIRPGRRIPFAKVVPPHWSPRSGMSDLITVGCSEGHDATAWSTAIVNPAMKGLNGNNAYEAIVCTNAPKQGRSGGGLFTSDGYIAGVCDFAEPSGNHGLYASPASIYKILDRNRLTALYQPGRAPGDGESMLADAGTPARPAPSRRKVDVVAAADEPQFRGQSPDRDDAPGRVTVPPPHLLNIQPPVLADNGSTQSATRRGAIRRQSWHAAPASIETEAAAGAVKLELDPALDPDRFDDREAPPKVAEPESPRSVPRDARKAEPTAALGRPQPTPGKWRAGRAPLPPLSVGGER